MRIAGAGPHFPYSADHADYINIAKQMATGAASGWVVTAERPDAYAPQPGDLICMGRGQRCVADATTTCRRACSRRIATSWWIPRCRGRSR